ncbi:MAG TPA: hypothetical protein VNW89_18200, partial [Stellaceae bacterium]|nr:hypothetical protein [Stellaceae bacterium]
TLDENLAERIRAVLAGTGSVREVRMFGGLCFMLNGNMVAYSPADRRLGPASSSHPANLSLPLRR